MPLAQADACFATQLERLSRNVLAHHRSLVSFQHSPISPEVIPDWVATRWLRPLRLWNYLKSQPSCLTTWLVFENLLLTFGEFTLKCC